MVASRTVVPPIVRVDGLPTPHEGENVLALFSGHSKPSPYFCLLTLNALNLSPVSGKTSQDSCRRAIPRAKTPVIHSSKKYLSKHLASSLRTLSSPRTATAIDWALLVASDFESTRASIAFARGLGWPAGGPVEIELTDILSISSKNFAVSKAEAWENDEPILANTLEHYAFIDAGLESHAVYVQIAVEGRPSLEFVTYERDSSLADELSAAWYTALARLGMEIGPSRLFNHSTFLINVQSDGLRADGSRTQPDAVPVITELEAAVVTTTYPGIKNKEDSAIRFRTKKALVRQQKEEEQFIVACQKVVALLKRSEVRLLEDIALKRAFFNSTLLPTTLLNWLKTLDGDLLHAIRSNQAKWPLFLPAVSESTMLENSASAHVRAIQLGLVQRATAGLRCLSAALHDCRGLHECFLLFNLPGWPLHHLVNVLVVDHFNYSEQVSVQGRSSATKPWSEEIKQEESLPTSASITANVQRDQINTTFASRVGRHECDGLLLASAQAA